MRALGIQKDKIKEYSCARVCCADCRIRLHSMCGGLALVSSTLLPQNWGRRIYAAEVKYTVYAAGQLWVICLTYCILIIVLL